GEAGTEDGPRLRLLLPIGGSRRLDGDFIDAERLGMLLLAVLPVGHKKPEPPPAPDHAIAQIAREILGEVKIPPQHALAEEARHHAAVDLVVAEHGGAHAPLASHFSQESKHDEYGFSSMK